MDNFFGSNSKGALQDTIRHQQEKLGKYEKKLGDLVKAYKVLQEEKKALQETVSAFSNNPTVNESMYLRVNFYYSLDKFVNLYYSYIR